MIAEALADGARLAADGRDRRHCSTATASRSRPGAGPRTRAAAAAAAAELGGPVALKAEGPEILHKSELGAVRIGLAGPAEVERGGGGDGRGGSRAAGVERESFLVQSMVEGGVELLVGVVGDAVFGPVLACGAGGTTAELLRGRLRPGLPADRGRTRGR